MLKPAALALITLPLASCAAPSANGSFGAVVGSTETGSYFMEPPGRSPSARPSAVVPNSSVRPEAVTIQLVPDARLLDDGALRQFWRAFLSEASSPPRRDFFLTVVESRRTLFVERRAHGTTTFFEYAIHLPTCIHLPVREQPEWLWPSRQSVDVQLVNVWRVNSRGAFKLVSLNADAESLIAETQGVLESRARNALTAVAIRETPGNDTCAQPAGTDATIQSAPAPAADPEAGDP